MRRRGGRRALARAPLARGLCKLHHRLVSAAERLDEVGLSSGEVQRLPSLPHFYLDKNVVIRFAFFENFGSAPERRSVALVQAVLRKRLRRASAPTASAPSTAT